MENLNYMLRDYISILVGVMVDEEFMICVVLIYFDIFYYDIDGLKIIYFKILD